MGEHKTIMGKDLYWMNFFGLMILTLIEVAAVGLDLSPETTGLSYTEKELTLFILVGIGPVSYTHLTLPTIYSV